MNLTDERYARFALCQEMFDTIKLVSAFDPLETEGLLEPIRQKRKMFLTGEGSSRLFPAKHLVYQNAIRNSGIEIFTEYATQALEYDLTNSVVFGMSNSGKSRELINLFSYLNGNKHDAMYGITANSGTPLEKLVSRCFILKCGVEKAVAATKSVIEEALFYHSLHFHLLGIKMEGLQSLAGAIRVALETSIDPALILKIAEAPVVYFAGRNNGVAEEITLKTNEIARKPSGYFEGTYAVHGVEEAMNKKDVVIIFDPFREEEEKFKQVLSDGLGVQIIAIASRPTLFPTIRIPDGGNYRNYVELAMGWNVLTEVGIALGIDLDKTVHARKIGNEYMEKGAK
jgi:glutamine---fructose-6-phosphate transaminase (isomerizing)